MNDMHALLKQQALMNMRIHTSPEGTIGYAHACESTGLIVLATVNACIPILVHTCAIASADMHTHVHAHCYVHTHAITSAAMHAN